MQKRQPRQIGRFVAETPAKIPARPFGVTHSVLQPARGSENSPASTSWTGTGSAHVDLVRVREMPWIRQTWAENRTCEIRVGEPTNWNSRRLRWGQPILRSKA